MLSIHPQARTTPAARQEIARSTEPTGVLAKRFSVSTETVRKWRKRGGQGVAIAERSVTNLLDRYDELLATRLMERQPPLSSSA
jgi:transposase-like protein